jgi:hypothetical protein
MSQNMDVTSFYHQKFEFDQFSQPNVYLPAKMMFSPAKMEIHQPKLFNIFFNHQKLRFTNQKKK